MKNTLIGIDTLHLNPVEWELSDDFSAKIYPAAFESGSGELAANYQLYTVAGRTFQGARALKQLESCNVEFNPYPDQKTGVWHVSTKINLTIPKIVTGDNYNPADCQQFIEALAIAQVELTRLGFKTNLNTAIVKRMDAARTLQARDKWLTYRPALAVLNPSKMTGTGFESGQRWQNGQRQRVLYEKGLEIASRFPKKQRAEVYSRYPINSFRAEARLMERESFQAATGMRTAGDALSDFSHLQSVYRGEFKKVFRFTPSEVERLKMDALSVDEIANELLHFINSGKRYWLEEWIQADWIANRVIDADRLEVIKAAIKKATELKGLASQNVSAKQKALENLFLQHAKLIDSKRSVGDLYSEIQSKVLE